MAIVLDQSGSPQYVNLSTHGASFDIRSRPIAVYFEAKWTATGIMLPFSHGRYDGGQQEYAVFLNISASGRIIGRWEDSTSNLFQTGHSGGYNDGEWHKILYVVASSTNNAYLFVDGTLVATSALDADLDTDDGSDLTAIGYDLDTGGFGFAGELANVAVWSTQPTQQQGEDLTAGVITPADLLITDQIAHYPLDYDSRDISGNGLHGTDVGSPGYTEEPPVSETETWDGASSGTDINGDHTWTKVQEASGAGSWQVDANRLRLASSTESYNTARAEVDLGTADHFVEAELELENGASNEAGVCARFATSENTWYAAVMSPRNGSVYLVRCVNGTRTYIASRAETIAAGTYTVRITCDGDQITGSFEGFSDLSVTDTGITTGTRWGAYGRSRGLIWGHWWDNFTAQDLSFPISISDDFNRSNEDLDAGPWIANGNWQVLGNEAFQDLANRYFAVHTTALATDHQRATAKWVSGNSGLLVRATSDLQSGYFCNIYTGAIREIWKLVDGTPTHITTLASGGVAISTGDTMYMEAQGDTLRVGVVGGGEMSITDSSILTGRYAGLAAGGSTDVTLDNFTARDLGFVEESSASSEESSSAGEEHEGSGVTASITLTPGSAEGHPSITADGTTAELILVPGLGDGETGEAETFSGSGLAASLTLEPGAGLGSPAIAADANSSPLWLVPGAGTGSPAVGGDGVDSTLVLVPTGFGGPGFEGPGVEAVIILEAMTGAGYIGSYVYRSNRALVAIPDTRTLIALED